MTQTRFVKSVIATAAKTEVQMPWARGARRTAMIARRNAPHIKVKSA
ncbi:hypothetical protein KBY31_04935 [Ruegeria pomeroyi]|nr:hypothetical protein [Ruegeria pomeroyi]MCE8553667.1 hypothetical protein [Ruegeria pomeroyi]